MGVDDGLVISSMVLSGEILTAEQSAAAQFESAIFHIDTVYTLGLDLAEVDPPYR